jgi:hypothetical protein
VIRVMLWRWRVSNAGPLPSVEFLTRAC